MLLWQFGIIACLRHLSKTKLSTVPKLSQALTAALAFDMRRWDATCALQSPFEAAFGAAMPPGGLITSPGIHSRCLHIQEAAVANEAEV